MTNHAFIDIRFDGPPSHEAPRFIEVEDPAGASVKVGEWINDGGEWLLRIKPEDIAKPKRTVLDLMTNEQLEGLLDLFERGVADAEADLEDGDIYDEEDAEVLQRKIEQGTEAYALLAALIYPQHADPAVAAAIASLG